MDTTELKQAALKASLDASRYSTSIVVEAETILALIAEVERLTEQWNTRFNTLCGNCGSRYRGPRDEDQHGLGICNVPQMKESHG